MKKVRITPAHAHTPEALAVFLSNPERPLPYRWWTRWSDHWAGRRDRTAPPHDLATEIPDADTPWLRRLAADCANAIATGRTRTEALVSILDRECAALQGEIEQAERAIAALGGDLDRLASTSITDEVRGAGEIYSPSEERLRRRHRESSLRSAELGGRLSAARAQHADARKRLEVLQQERASHWVLLQERARVLAEHHQRRAATYTRALENRRAGQFWAVPQLAIPTWVRAELSTGGGTDDPIAPVLTFTPTN